MVILTWFAIIGGIYTLFAIAEDGLTPHIKEDVSHWLLRLDPSRQIVIWAESFTNIFDRVFGEKHVSWQCFWRSSTASIISVLVLTLIWAAFHKEDFVKDLDTAYSVPLFALGILFAVAAFNFLPDYLSLLETRYVIRLLCRQRSVPFIIGILAIDMLVTASIFTMMFIIATLLFIFLLMSLTDLVPRELPFRVVFHSFFSQEYLVQLSKSAFLFERMRPPTETTGAPVGVPFYSTFTTSAWIWLYLASSGLIRLALYLARGISWTKTILNIDEKPLKSMGFVSCLLVSVLYWGWVVVRWMKFVSSHTTVVTFPH